jgi:hypothetical protein
MKRASYRHAVELIALNDEPSEMDAEIVAGLASVVIVSGMFDVDEDKLARDVVRYRYLERVTDRESAP